VFRSSHRAGIAGFSGSFQIGRGIKLHVAGFGAGKFFHRDAGFDLAFRMLLCDGEEMQASKCFGGILLYKLPFVHAA